MKNKLASAADIHSALLGQGNSQNLRLVTAKNDDILQALMLTESAINDNQLATNLEKSALISTNLQVIPKQIKTTTVNLKKLSNLTGLPITLNEQYYLNSEKGYVVQIRGFSDLSKLKAFIKENKDQEYFSYQRNLNTQKFFALTSKIFSNKAQARDAMNKLPQAIKDLGSFLKSVK
jgi:hypothetical protein